MLRTFKATIKNNHVEWDKDIQGQINSESPIPVYITLLDESEQNDIEYQGKCMILALNQLVNINACTDITDPANWEREIRRERQLPGRQDVD